MGSITFAIEGRPRGKERPRVTRNGTYTPKQTRELEAEIGALAMQAMTGNSPFTGPVRVIVLACFPIPKRTPLATRQAMLRGDIYPVVSPDLDNIEKAVLDAMNKVVFEDDRQVVLKQGIKRYAETGETVVTVEEVEAA